MSAVTSPTTQRAYGVARVCAAWDVPRSSYYAQQKPAVTTIPVVRRGPKPGISDAELLALIRADLATSPFKGEGHRKVWARLRVVHDVRVSRKRVQRLMRENHLLSPHRVRQCSGDAHPGHIITDAPNIMWGSDGTRIFTVDDGWVWVFTAVEHWNSECVGWHVCKIGSRFAALEAVSMGLTKVFGSTKAGVARGLSLRIDHGSQFLADHYLNQVRFWGISPSFAFVEQPQTNGVAERFNRTLKEQAIHGRVFRNIEEVRQAVNTFIPRYNAEWLVEKLCFVSPNQARVNYDARRAA